jgi:sterol desaturase/sphingolipid hydroxylase (fatty acid hydroxylase superfamily)
VEYFSLFEILATLGIYLCAHVLSIALMAVIEAKKPGRVFTPFSAGWKVNFAIIYVFNYLIVSTAAFFIFYDTPLIHLVWQHALPKYWTNPFSGGLAGFIFYSFLLYWWHRLLHYGPLWNSIHRVHHSAEKVSAVISEYKHPAEYFAGVILFYVTINFLWLDIPQTAVASVLTILADVFLHTNVKTPMWLGYVLVRPEAHRLHHRREISNCNYSFFAPWDIIFGTYRNPKEMEEPCGIHFSNGENLKELILTRKK